MYGDSMNIFRLILRNIEQRRAQKLITGLSRQLTQHYADSVKEALLQQKENLIYIHGTGRDLAVDLSPEGIAKELNHLPSSITAQLKAEKTPVKRLALQLAFIVEYYETKERLKLPILPAVREWMVKLLEGEIRKSE